MSKFKVGEKVLLIKNVRWNNSGDMDHWNKTIQIIERISNHSDPRYYFEGGGSSDNFREKTILNSWIWTEDMMTSVDNKPKLKIKVKI